MSTRKKMSPRVSSGSRHEIRGLVYLALAAFILLCLVSYDKLDPSFSTSSGWSRVNNLGGVVGAYLADIFFLIFGWCAYALALVLLGMALGAFLGKSHSMKWREGFIGMLFVVSACILLELHVAKGPTEIFAPGGLIGSMMGSWALTFLGKTGATVLTVGVAMLALVTVTPLSVVGLASFLRSAVVWLVSEAYEKFFFMGVRCQKLLPLFLRGLWGFLAGVWQRLLWPFRGPPRVKITEPVRPDFVRKKSPLTPNLPLSGAAKNPSGPPALQPFPSDTHVSGPRILDRVDKDRKPSKKADDNQLEFLSIGVGYQLPPLSLLDSESHAVVSVDTESLRLNSRLLEKKLNDFGVSGRVTEIHPGPVVTMYEYQPAAGVKINRIVNLVDDLALVMGGRPVRVVAPLPDKPAVGIEIPNNVRETVWLKDIIADHKFQRADSKLCLALGKDIEGMPFVADLARMPHLLVAGATGAGKSVSINAMILSLLYKATPEEVRLIMVDPKMLELSLYEGIPHLLLPVVTQPKQASLALKWAVREMERRYVLMSDVNARNIKNYNHKIEKNEYPKRSQAEVDASAGKLVIHQGKIPTIVILIDELADLMMVSSHEVEESITRLAQMARAAGIHLILATQRPSVDVITGIIKANFPARISFKVSSKHDARTILDRIGSEHLLGSGDMLYLNPSEVGLCRVHGAYVTETEIGRVVGFLKQQGKPTYNEEILKAPPAETADEFAAEGDLDHLYDTAVAIVAETRQASISMIQRRLRIGYNRAARMIEKMETEGIVSPPDGTKNRTVLVSSFEG